MTSNEKKQNLKNFFQAPVNQTSRERIFFHRLAFDLKIAAANAGYHLHIYEPDVDRDGFDIIVEDEDFTRQLQTKAVLSSVGTAQWYVVAGFLWPDLQTIEDYGCSPVKAGRGGGVILIEINDDNGDAEVVYSYTDYTIIEAISQGFLVQIPKTKSGRGRPSKPARLEASELIKALWDSSRHKNVAISRKLFLRLSGAEQLLGLIGMQSLENYGLYAINKAYRLVFVDEAGRSQPCSPMDETSALSYQIDLLVKAQAVDKHNSKSTYFRKFEWVKK